VSAPNPAYVPGEQPTSEAADATVLVPLTVWSDICWLLGFGHPSYHQNPVAKELHEGVREWMSYMNIQSSTQPPTDTGGDH
jgi:hypothetical protein